MQGRVQEGAQGARAPPSAPPYIILVSAFYLLSSLMTYTFSKTVLVIFQILYKNSLCLNLVAIMVAAR